MTSNGTINDTEPSRPVACDGFVPDTPAETSWKTFAYCFIALGSLLGNSLVIVVIFKNRSMRSTINYFIVNMASSDILFAVFVIPRLISELYSEPLRWFIGGTLGSVLCKLDFFVQDISTAVSILSLVAIAFDRFYGVVFPMKAGLMNGGKVCGMVLAGTWLLAALLHLPYFYALKLSEINDNFYCVFNWSPLLDHVEASKVYFVVLSITFFFLPAAILMVVYITIIVTLWRNKIPGNQSVKYKQRIAKRNRSVLKMVVAVVVVFLCCWLPVNVSIYFALFLWETGGPCYIATLFFWVVLLAYSNVCISPYLYFIFNENFRQGFGKVFCRRQFRGSLRNNPRSTRRRTRTDAVSVTFMESIRRKKT